MANRLPADRDASPVGQRWASNFFKRQPDLKTYFNHTYDWYLPHDRQAGLLKPDVKLQALTQTGPLPEETDTWVSLRQTTRHKNTHSLLMLRIELAIIKEALRPQFMMLLTTLQREHRQ
ncbi:hypothetical protein HOO65_050403 [Ceratocystis lukuohia]|uniref:Transposase n=1 Tax=Ceratocystis lukuohia TaxID=2019550 RepID=A0ABR4MGC7_9PEZI